MHVYIFICVCVCTHIYTSLDTYTHKTEMIYLKYALRLPSNPLCKTRCYKTPSNADCASIQHSLSIYAVLCHDLVDICVLLLCSKYIFMLFIHLVETTFTCWDYCLIIHLRFLFLFCF